MSTMDLVFLAVLMLGMTCAGGHIGWILCRWRMAAAASRAASLRAAHEREECLWCGDVVSAGVQRTRQVVCPACLRENYSLRPPHWAEIGEGRAA